MEGGVELFVAVGVGLFTIDAEIEVEGELGVPEPELVEGLPVGLLLGEPLAVELVGRVGPGDAEVDEALAEADASALL